MAFVQAETSFYVLRLLLGIAEAGLFPGVMLYLTYWFNRAQRARATGYFLLGVCFANIIGGPVGAALMRMDGMLGWHGWQWMFLLEGLPAVAFAWVVWRKLPDRPSKAPWLSAEEARGIEQRIAMETEEGAGEGGHSLKNWLTPQILLAIFVYFCHQITIYTVIFFLPSIISKYGELSTMSVGLLTSLPWIAAAAGAVLLPRFATTPTRARPPPLPPPPSRPPARGAGGGDPPAPAEHERAGRLEGAHRRPLLARHARLDRQGGPRPARRAPRAADSAECDSAECGQGMANIDGGNRHFNGGRG